MNQSVCSDNGSDSKKDNDDDISERTESVLEKKIRERVGGLGNWTLCWGSNLYYYGKKKQTYITMERRN